MILPLFCARMMGQHGVDDPRDTKDVHIEDTLRLSDRRFLGGAKQSDPCIVDDKVETARLPHDVCNQRSDRNIVRHVRRPAS